MLILNQPSLIASADLPEKPLAEPLAGAATARSRVDFVADASRVISGVWEADPGTSRWVFDDRGEMIHVLSGAMTVQEDGGDPVDVVAGATAYFPVGWVGTWTITERLRKFYVVFKP